MVKNPVRIFSLFLVLPFYLLEVSASHAAQNGGESTEFPFTGWQGPALPVRLYVPDGDARTAPIVIIMHGASRDAPRYFRDWSAAAARHGFIAVVPYFSKTDFDRSSRYNLGYVFDPDTQQRRPRASWSFAAIEPLFDEVRRRVGSTRQAYTLYGHSAGAQFVHRFLYFEPRSRAERFIAANAGWYTLPDLQVAYPYGLAGSGLGASDLQRALGRELILLLGDRDTDPNGSNLRQSSEAQAQGPHRFARGRYMFEQGRETASQLRTPFAWRMETVPGAAHSNAQMTDAAATWLAGRP